MTPDDAIQRLIFHTQPEPGAFLDMLRPYGGLRDEVMIDLKASLRAAAPRISEQHLPRELVSALFEISYCGWLWALAPGGMLRRNHLITDADLKRLEDFLENFGYAVTMLLVRSTKRSRTGAPILDDGAQNGAQSNGRQRERRDSTRHDRTRHFGRELDEITAGSPES